MRTKITLALIAGALPLLVYPAVLMASIMLFDDPQPGSRAPLEATVRYCFYIGAILYPLIYAACVAAVFSSIKLKPSIAFKVAIAPVMFLAMLGALFFVLGKIEGEDSEPKEIELPLLMFGDVAYVHRWSNLDQHEFTPRGQEDIERWSDQVTTQHYLGVKDDEGLKSMANAVVESYRRRGAKVLRNDSLLPAGNKPAEQLAVLLLPAPGMTEAVFARFRLDGGVGSSIIYSHRVLGQETEGQMNTWLKTSESSTEKTLMGVQLPAYLK